MAEPFTAVNGNHDKCPICKKDPKHCPHPLAQMDKRVWEDMIRRIVREELERIGRMAEQGR